MSSEPPDSGATYIIICSGRTAVQNAHNIEDKITAVSQCAGHLAAFMSVRYRQTFKNSDLQTVSTLQHELMNAQKNGLNRAEIEAKIQMLIDEFYVLEGKYTGATY